MGDGVGVGSEVAVTPCDGDRHPAALALLLLPLLEVGQRLVGPKPSEARGLGLERGSRGGRCEALLSYSSRVLEY